MEQKHIGPSSPPTHAAGVDPAFIPGLMPARPAEEPEDRVPGAPEVPEAAEVSEEPEADSAPEGEPEEAVAEAEGADGGPVFEVSDRRGAIVADRGGVVFRLDTEEARFGWGEIKAVEFDTPRFGRRFSVTVYTSPQRWFQNEVEAPSRADLKTWSRELDAVLDVRFDDGEKKQD
ncbi:hypothetical protein [Streptomyces inusitatus]|uniref:hypothetical protein n=1 Tax=Streptomyces inusitatus TaxID=68221 RepID=UPI00167CA856|nr:hypothetical protein [Streptomyces inusitatus]